MMHSKVDKYIVSLDVHTVHVQVCNMDIPCQTEGYFDQCETVMLCARRNCVWAAVSRGESEDVGGDG